MPYIELTQDAMPGSKLIVDDTSTIAYEDFVAQKRRTQSSGDTESVASGPTFSYQQPNAPAQVSAIADTTVNDEYSRQQPPYVCYPQNSYQQYPPAQYPAYQCYPQQPAYVPHYAYAPQPYPAQNYQPQGYQQYHCYPASERFPSLAGASQTVPASAPTSGAAIESKENDDAAAEESFWIGRTRAQVNEDNLKLAARENVFKNDPMKPANATPDTLFWVVELDGRTTLRMFKTIDEDLGLGRWEKDPRHGNAYFVREEAKDDKP
ncbi:hypothetical protein CAC42_221 [Sphaceloma murrayae]|uniref:Uncharacterized protein n=1 Tax=Sphaceloma murrayae TaxID=2082308 RepID=A0A2K1QMX8_9PEZI|nr:hypothetical protein CAC42_221 [Sphaceloma murrayae]